MHRIDNASGVLSSSSSSSQETTNDDRNIDEETFSSKMLMLMQFQPEFQFMVMLNIFVSYFVTFFDAALAWSTDLSNIPRTYSGTALSFLYWLDIIYAVDILSMLAYKDSNYEEIKHMHAERSTLLVVFDIISIIPFDAVYFALAVANMQVLYTLRLRYMLRIFRFVQKLHEVQFSVAFNHIKVEYIMLPIKMIIAVLSMTFTNYIVICWIKDKKCVYFDQKSIMNEVKNELANISGVETYLIPDALIYYILYLIACLLIYSLVIELSVAVVLLSAVYKNKERFNQEFVQNSYIQMLRSLGKVDALIFSSLKLSNVLRWRHTKDLNIEMFDSKIIPEAMMRDITLDICWDALKHSHLFRNKEVHFLRYVSSFMVQKFMIPGEIIFCRGHFKSAMVYISRGNVQILSSCDGETPIISFSAGTCIGESSLILDTRASNTVLCESWCMVYVLYRKDYIKIISRYPDVHKIILQQMANRCEEARQCQDIFNRSYVSHKRDRDTLSLKWLKMTLLALFDKDKHNDEFLGTFKSVDRQTKTLINDTLFCPNHLDKLVICDTENLKKDKSFIKFTCPYIFLPNSFLITIWNNVVIITVIIFVFTYPYYLAFNPQLYKFFSTLCRVISLLWIVDIYVTISTAIKINDRLITDMNEIVLTRSMSITFLWDFVALIPLDLVFVIINPELSPQLIVMLHFPKYFKVYKLGKIFEGSISTIYIRTLLKSCFYLILADYYIGSLIYLSLCFNTVCNEQEEFYEFSKTFNLSTPLKTCFKYSLLMNLRFTLLGFSTRIEPSTMGSFLAYIFMFAVVPFIRMYIFSNIATVDTLVNYNFIRLQEYISELGVLIANIKVDKQLQKYMMKCVRKQSYVHNGFALLYSSSNIGAYITPALLKEVRTTAFSDMLREAPLFKEMPFEVIKDFCGGFYTRMVYPDEIISHSGQLCSEMHIISKGRCAIVSPTGEIISIISSGESISAVEMVFKIPTANTVISLTNCRLLSIDINTFIKIFQKHPELRFQMKKAIDEIYDNWNLSLLYPENVTYSLHLNDIHDQSFHYIGYRNLIDTKEGREYNEYFEQHELLIVLKYLLMRFTIRSQGNFIFYWEISRCIFAYLTAYFYSIPPLSLCQNCVWNYAFIFLDLTAWIDIYIRHHISYFNQDGIEVVHPVKTAIHYWQHAFLIDLLGVLRVDGILKYFITFRTSFYVMLVRFLHTLQLYRVVAFLFFSQNVSKNVIITVVPLTILFLNFVVCILLNDFCHFDDLINDVDIYLKEVPCVQGHYAIASMTSLYLYLHTYLAVTISMMKPSLPNLKYDSPKDLYVINILSTIGFIFILYLNARIIVLRLTKNSKLIAYQEAMHNLVKFLSYRRIDSRTKHEIIEHYEYIWRKTQGRNLHKMLENAFNQAIKEDVLYEVYGKYLKETRIFKDASTSFMRSLLLHVKHEMYLKRGLICRVNDINSKIFIVFKGVVEVLGPDYNKLLLLPIGSIFGNIDNCPRSRQTLTMVAKGHVEVLVIENSKFYDILSRYSTMTILFKQLISLNTDYLPGNWSKSGERVSLTGDALIRNKSTFQNKPTLQTNSVSETTGSVLHIFNYKINLSHVWEIIFLVFVCYLGSSLQLFSVTVVIHRIEIIGALYFIDFLQLVNIILRFYTPYQDEFGILITDRKMIANTYLKDPRGFRIEIVSLIPFELLALIAINQDRDLFWFIWNFLRCNRIIRAYFLFRYFKRKKEQLNINVLFIRCAAILTWMSFCMQVLLIILTYAKCASSSQIFYKACATKDRSYTSYFKRLINIFFIFKMQSNHYLVEYHNTELLVSVVIIVTCRIIQSVFLSEITAMVDSMFHIRSTFEENSKILKEHMERENISPPLYKRVWLYLCLLWEQNRGYQFPIFVEHAPYYLREAVMNGLFGFHLRRHPIFCECHTDLIRQIAAEMQTRIFFTHDYITFINDIDGSMYFVQDGSVNALLEDDMYSTKIERTYNKGDMFGFKQGIFADYGHEYSYQATKYTIIIVLKRNSWIHLLDFFPASRKLILDKLKSSSPP